MERKRVLSLLTQRILPKYELAMNWRKSKERSEDQDRYELHWAATPMHNVRITGAVVQRAKTRAASAMVSTTGRPSRMWRSGVGLDSVPFVLFFCCCSWLFFLKILFFSNGGRFLSLSLSLSLFRFLPDPPPEKVASPPIPFRRRGAARTRA